jgi:hypothetical protein
MEKWNYAIVLVKHKMTYVFLFMMFDTLPVIPLSRGGQGGVYKIHGFLTIFFRFNMTID